MGLARRQFGSILAEFNPAASEATLSTGDLVLHRIQTPEHARLLVGFWLRSDARCTDAIVQALHWIMDGLENKA